MGCCSGSPTVGVVGFVVVVVVVVVLDTGGTWCSARGVLHKYSYDTTAVKTLDLGAKIH